MGAIRAMVNGKWLMGGRESGRGGCGERQSGDGFGRLTAGKLPHSKGGVSRSRKQGATFAKASAAKRSHHQRMGQGRKNIKTAKRSQFFQVPVLVYLVDLQEVAGRTGTVCRLASFCQNWLCLRGLGLFRLRKAGRIAAFLCHVRWLVSQGSRRPRWECSRLRAGVACGWIRLREDQPDNVDGSGAGDFCGDSLAVLAEHAGPVSQSHGR